MKIGIFSPYLDTASGGEKYILTAAQCLSRNNEVYILLDEKLSKIGWEQIRAKNEKVHGLDLSKLIPLRFLLAKVHVLWKLKFVHSLDLMLVNCDGSFSYSSAKRGYLHFQLPVKLKRDLWSRVKAASWTSAIYNSQFTKDFIENQFKFDGKVIYPPVDVESFKSNHKKKMILNVGRFVERDNPKKQDVLIDVFKRLVEVGRLKDWSLHLAGGLMEGNEEWLTRLREKASGSEVFFYPNIALNELVKLCANSSIYWHAMGYGEVEPKRFEHFGISTVEAMAASCVPVVINKGGQREIVINGENGYLWDSIDDLVDYTLLLINDSSLRKTMANAAAERAKDFGKQAFVAKIEELTYEK